MTDNYKCAGFMFMILYFLGVFGRITPLQAQEVIMTGILHGDLTTNNLPRAIELYIEGTVNLINYRIERSTNGTGFVNSEQLTGTYTDEFVYLVSGQRCVCISIW
ncbi:MAG: hypothetical protein HC880_14480 [Bacteroidia bacterium]|nr:hypothetical protein [Bacteroidia bacterium]